MDIAGQYLNDRDVKSVYKWQRTQRRENGISMCLVSKRQEKKYFFLNNKVEHDWQRSYAFCVFLNCSFYNKLI